MTKLEKALKVELYVSPNGKKVHLKGCHYLRKSKGGTRVAAEHAAVDVCKVCHRKLADKAATSVTRKTRASAAKPATKTTTKAPKAPVRRPSRPATRPAVAATARRSSVKVTRGVPSRATAKVRRVARKSSK